jgi:hypothetical protein
MRLRAYVLSLIVLGVPAFASACGGGQPEATQPANAPPSASASAEAPASSSAAAASASVAPSATAAPSASATEAAGPPAPPKEGEWDTWSHDQKLAYMKAAVMPKMGALFHDFDAKRYAEPKCALCHGSGAKDGSFKMPNPELPKLDLSPAGMKAMHAKKAAVVEFMAKQVMPTTAQLIGEAPFDLQTHKGFGCLGCHTAKK